jgi:hypothetical protein
MKHRRRGAPANQQSIDTIESRSNCAAMLQLGIYQNPANQLALSRAGAPIYPSNRRRSIGINRIPDILTKHLVHLPLSGLQFRNPRAMLSYLFDVLPHVVICTAYIPFF